MYILQLDPWKFWFFSNKVPGGSSQNRGGLARRFPARGSPAARARWGRSERRSCSTDLRVLVATRMTGGEGSAVAGVGEVLYGGGGSPARDWGHVRADELRQAEEKSAVGFIWTKEGWM